MLLEFLEKSRAYIFDTLKNESPEDWWDEKIPTKIKKSCAFAQIEDNYNHEPSYYLDKFQDLSEIVENNWKSLGGIFADPNGGSKRKDKIKWLSQFASYRVRVTKPERDPITEREFKFISETIKRVYSAIE